MAAPTIFDRLGGQDSIDVLVRRFYDRVYADPEIAAFFVDVSEVDLEQHQRAFIGMLVGGPARYEGRPLDIAHAGLGITDRQFDRIVNHLVDAMSVSSVPSELVEAMRNSVSALRGQVVDGS